MRFLSSQKWSGIAVIIGVVGLFAGPWISTIITQKTVNLQLLGTNVNSFTFSKDEADMLLKPGWRDRSFNDAMYVLINQGTKALTTDDYINPVSVRATDGLQIASVSSRLSTSNLDSQFDVGWKQGPDGNWQMPPQFLNPTEAVIVRVFTVSPHSNFSDQEVREHLKWTGRFKEIVYPEPIGIDVQVTSKFFLVWTGFGVIVFQQGFGLFRYLALAMVAFSILTFLGLRAGLASNYLPFTIAELFFVIISFCFADTLSPITAGIPGFYWHNMVPPLVFLAVACGLYLLPGWKAKKT